MRLHNQKPQTQSSPTPLEILMRSALNADEEKIKQAVLVLQGKAPKPHLNGPLLLGMGKAAELLGVSRTTLWRMIKVGRIAKLEILQGSYRIRREDLEGYIRREDLLTTGTGVSEKK